MPKTPSLPAPFAQRFRGTLSGGDPVALFTHVHHRETDTFHEFLYGVHQA